MQLPPALSSSIIQKESDSISGNFQVDPSNNDDNSMEAEWGSSIEKVSVGEDEVIEIIFIKYYIKLL